MLDAIFEVNSLFDRQCFNRGVYDTSGSVIEGKVSWSICWGVFRDSVRGFPDASREVQAVQ